MSAGALTDVPGLRVGHWTSLEAATGCTVVLSVSGALAGVDVRGSAPGTRETDLLRPGSLVGRVHAILLAGGSAFGLDAAAGVMRYLEERGAGFPTPAGPVPIVSAAVLYDLSIGRADVRPDMAAGYQACVAAGDQVAEGSVGAGAGCTVAKLAGIACAIKGGIGSASVQLPGGHVVAALVAVNALGAVYDPADGRPVAVPRSLAALATAPLGGTNTTIGLVATTARLDHAALTRLASQAHDGLARTIHPSHTLYDGDTLFALSLPSGTEEPAEPIALGQAAAEAVSSAVLRAVRLATPLHGIPSAAG
jgi:L-aminopeptidase/D-esterase-like protein